MRDSFIFYRSFYEATKHLSKDDKVLVFDLIFSYQFDEKISDAQGVPLAIFTAIKPQIDINNKRYENGSKGGRPAKSKNQTETKPKPKNNQTITKVEPNKNENVNANENVNKKEKAKRLAAYLSGLGIGLGADGYPEEWPDEWFNWAKQNFPNLASDEIFTELESMADWSKASPDGAKLDWLGTWRNWVRRKAPEIEMRKKRENLYGKSGK